MEATTSQERIREDLARELDSLGDKIDMAAQFIADLRAERAELRAQCESLERDRQRVLESAGVEDSAELLRVLDRLKDLQRENEALLAERDEVARRLGKLREKVDLLDHTS